MKEQTSGPPVRPNFRLVKSGSDVLVVLRSIEETVQFVNFFHRHDLVCETSARNWSRGSIAVVDEPSELEWADFVMTRPINFEFELGEVG